MLRKDGIVKHIIVNNKIQCTGQKLLLQPGGTFFQQINMDLRIPSGKFRNQRRQHIGGKQVAASNGKTARFQLIQIGDIIGKIILNAEDLFNRQDIFFTAVRQPDGIAAAIKNRCADLFFGSFYGGLKAGWEMYRFLAALEKLFSLYTS